MAWSRLAWYGHIMVFGTLAFFYGGGTKVLHRMRAQQVHKAGKDKEERLRSAESSGYNTPARVQTLPPLDDVAREMEKTEFMRKLND